MATQVTITADPALMLPSPYRRGNQVSAAMSLAGLLALTFAGLPGPPPHPDGSPPTETLMPAVPGAESPIGPPDGLRPSSLGSRLAKHAVQPCPDHTDLALLIGEPGRGPQFELGALGGGRSDAPGLVHVGVRFGF